MSTQFLLCVHGCANAIGDRTAVKWQKLKHLKAEPDLPLNEEL